MGSGQRLMPAASNFMMASLVPGTRVWQPKLDLSTSFTEEFLLPPAPLPSGILNEATVPDFVVPKSLVLPASDLQSVLLPASDVLKEPYHCQKRVWRIKGRAKLGLTSTKWRRKVAAKGAQH